MNCPVCGASLPNGAWMCDQCGASIGGAVPGGAPAPRGFPPPGPPAAGGSTCPSCGTPFVPGTAFCDNCGASIVGSAVPSGAPVPVTSATPAPTSSYIYIVVWGPRSSGKTMFLFMLYDEIRMRQTDWEMRIFNETADKFWEQLTERKFQHRFAEATTAQSPEEIVIEFKRQDHRHSTWEDRRVKVLDLPGEWYENRSLAVGQGGSNVVDDYLKKCKGLLCLVDPNAKPEDLSKYFDKLLMRLQMLCGQPTDKRLAVCLTKMDERAHRLKSGIGNPESWLCLTQPNEYTRCPHCQKSEKYVKDILGGGIMTEINKTFRQDKIRYFASSAIGLYPGVSVERSNSGIDWQGNPIIYEVRNIKPFGLFAPFCDWLLQD
jgi:GTPase SAR1 family protein